METIEYRFTDKSRWPDGEWKTEPDKRQWSDPETGLPCLIVRNLGGALCGYVGVPASHHHFGDSYNHLDVRVHGGLTFSDRCSPEGEHGICHVPGPGESDEVWWFGFDCSHAGDIDPDRDQDHINRYLGLGYTYKNIAYVQDQVTQLAKQLAAV